MKKLKYIVKRVGDWLMFMLTGKGAIADEAIREGIISYEGQGRDAYGR